MNWRWFGAVMGTMVAALVLTQGDFAAAGAAASVRRLHVGDAQTAAMLPTADALKRTDAKTTSVALDSLENAEAALKEINAGKFDVLAIQLFGHRSGMPPAKETELAAAIIKSFLAANPEARVWLLGAWTDGSAHYDEVTDSWDGHSWIDHTDRAMREHHAKVAADLQEQFGAERIGIVPLGAAMARIHREIQNRGEQSPIWHISQLLAKDGMSANPSRRGIYYSSLVWLAATTDGPLPQTPEDDLDIEAGHLTPKSAPLRITQEEADMMKDAARAAVSAQKP